ncbi:hypothetical protein H4R99_005473 [Coemansia sp. RSA 1722]|nr:hypothetical protein LPJ57_006093 [Coemansia sp. RSA 486]KAJ2236115.1 hypothetical protein IWW45_002036 [Coemansia sp. RSA 485]KAJ2595145.1 hypothetical protein H4R99_005473 [Coemansia sp. RSA 1722]
MPGFGSMSETYLWQQRNRGVVRKSKNSKSSCRRNSAQMILDELAKGHKVILMTAASEFQDWMAQIAQLNLSTNIAPVKMLGFDGDTFTESQVNDHNAVIVTYDDAYHFLSSVQEIPFHLVVIDHTSTRKTSLGSQLATDTVLEMFFEYKRWMVDHFAVEYV